MSTVRHTCGRAILNVAAFVCCATAWGAGKDGLVAHWTFNEARPARITDRSGNGNAISLHAPLETYRIQQVTCEKGKALLFSEYPLWGTCRIEGGPAESYSAAAWVHPLAFASQKNSYRNIVTLKSKENEQVFRFAIRGPGALYVQTRAGWAISPWESLHANLWQHVGFSYDQKVLRMYINGKEAAARETDGDAAASLPRRGVFQLGGVQRGFAWSRRAGANVGMDDCRLYHRALSPEEFASLYRSGKNAYAVTEKRTWSEQVDELTIVSYNMMQYRGRYLKARAPKNAPDFWEGGGPRGDAVSFFTKTLKSLDADVYVLQEAAYPPMSKALAGAMSYRYAPAEFDPDAYKAGRHITSGAILSKYPIVQFREYARFHMNQAKAEIRMFCRAVVDVPGPGKIMIYNVHLWPYGPDNGVIEQVAICRIVDEERQLGVPQILVGDFNRRADSFLLEHLARNGWRNVVKEAGAHVPGTWNVDRQYANIDWMLARGADGWALKECEVVRNSWTAGVDGAAFVASDHLPVRAVFARP